MIFFAVASPTPGRDSRSFCEAVFRSTGPFDAIEADFEASFDISFDAAAAAGGGGAAGRPSCATTIGEIFSIVDFETPACERSATDA